MVFHICLFSHSICFIYFCDIKCVVSLSIFLFPFVFFFLYFMCNFFLGFPLYPLVFIVEIEKPKRSKNLWDKLPKFYNYN